MKTVWLTIDIEEWYHLEYIKKYIENIGTFRVVPLLGKFLEELDELNIKATFFILGELAEENADILRKITSKGHAIGCHGLDHDPLYNKSNEQFYDQIVEAKRIIEEIVGFPIQGYRASCFSMVDDKLDILEKAGFTYDSSYIKFEQHDLYKILKLDGFNKIDSLMYKKNSFYEFEIPTLKVFKYNVPISGGGYIRLLPLWILKILLKKYFKTEKNFLLYVHPFELTESEIPIPANITLKERVRMIIGRRNNLKKIVKLLKYLKNQGATFEKMSVYSSRNQRRI